MDWQAMTDEPPAPENELLDDGDKSETDLEKDAEAGRRIHRLYSGVEDPEATQAERDRAEQGRQIDLKMKQQWLGFFECEPEAQITELREHRWWLKDESGKDVYSGQSDVAWIRGNFGEDADILVGDLKGLWGEHDPAPINVQIRRYIALIAVNLKDMGFSGVRSAMAYLNQPAVTLNPVPVQFDQPDIAKAIVEMWEDLYAMMDENAERTPGPRQCGKCRGKLICPEFQSEVGVLPVIQESIPIDKVPPEKEEITKSVAALDGPRLARVVEWSAALRNLADAAKAEAKKRLGKDPASVPGWSLKPNSPREKIENLVELWGLLSKRFALKPESFVQACTISKEAVEKILRERTNMKGQALEALQKEILEGLCVKRPVASSLNKKG